MAMVAAIVPVVIPLYGRFTMELALSGPRGLWKSVLVGLIAAVGTALVTVPLFLAGIPPMPKPPSLAFAETLLGPVPPPVGVLFHLVYVVAVTVLFLAVLGGRPGVWAMAAWAALLWVIALVVFFPIVGWGLAGFAVTPKVAVAAIGPHLLYFLLLWAGTRLVFRRETLGPTA